MATHSESEIMYLISPAFDILMLNAGFEGIWQRAASTFLGKKCYREIEKREEPCPHCPGIVALRTGTMSEAEGCAVLDDGTRIPFLLHAYPLYGVTGEPAGFVETAEDISERKRSEDAARYEAALVNDLLATSSISRVLGLGLEAALRLEGAESGCVFTVDPRTGVREFVARRGPSAPEMESLTPPTTSATVGIPEGATLLMRVPILCSRQQVAELAVRFSGDAHLWPTGRPKLEAVASLLVSALSRIKAERLRGDATINVQTVIGAIPLAAFFLDSRGTVTVWNDEAERVFGWSEADVLRRMPAFIPDGEEERFLALVSEATRSLGSTGFEFRCLHRNGEAHDVRFRAAPIRDVIGDGTSYLVITARADSGVSPEEYFTGDAQKQVSAGNPRESDLSPNELTHEALTAAQALGHLLQTVARGLAPTQDSGESVVPISADATGGMAGGKMSISWADSGSLDIHLRLLAGEERLAQDLPPAQTLVIQSEVENGRRLEEVLRDLGCSPTLCPSVSAALELLRGQNGKRPPELAIVDMVMPDGPSGVETAKLLMAAEPKLRVVVSSDRGVLGHTAHGFAAAISRPYTNDKVQSAVAEALRQRVR